jgi:hypothetical protein
LRRDSCCCNGDYERLPQCHYRRTPGKLERVAAALYTPEPKGQPKNGFDIGGFLAEQKIEVFPENWQTVTIFVQVSTQWRLGMSGPVGLDYNVLFRIMDNLNMPQQEWQDMFEDIRVMESTALDTMHTSNK